MIEEEKNPKEWTLRGALGTKIGTNEAVGKIKKLIKSGKITSTEDAITEWEEWTGLDSRVHLSDHELLCITVKKP